MTKCHPIIFLPNEYEVYDFTKGYDPERMRHSPFGIGKYNELRPGMYTGELFEKEQRNIHMGIDIAAPIGTAIYAFAQGSIVHQGYNPEPFDYGHVIVTEHLWNDGYIWALWGHLSKQSLQLHHIGQTFQKGDCIGFIGAQTENGGWNPHLHFQLCRFRPTTHDLPGVVSKEQHDWALQVFPDPQIILGRLYS